MNEIISNSLIRMSSEEAQHSGERCVDVLEKKLQHSPDVFIRRLGDTLHYQVAERSELFKLDADFDVLQYDEAARHFCVAARDPAGRLKLLFDDPFSFELEHWINEKITSKFVWVLVHRTDLTAFLARYEQAMRAADAANTSLHLHVRAEDGLEDLSLRSVAQENSEAVKLVRSTLREALNMGVSDIHFENAPSGMSIKFRLDGMLLPDRTVQDKALAEQAVSRIKVLAQLDITERRVPQDGRFKAHEGEREVDFRVSVMPGIHGEDVVLRILDKQALRDQMHALNLESLGFRTHEIELLRRMASEPYGMFLATGPTGSGKTTTLYAAISEVNHGNEKIITIEDPVEYQLAGVLQIPVNEKKGLGFARGLRSILRHDPDKIMVGEIRDAETANIAVQSALTGHLVFTTVHANNVFDVIGRFMYMNVDFYSFVSALNGVLAQRLVRMVCPHCVVPYQPDEKLIKASGLNPQEVGTFNFVIGQGCGHCRGSGYKGRKVIAEILVLTDELREMITSRQPVRTIKEAARLNGTRFLRDAAMDAVQRGETTLQEINRVTFVA
ncbi:MAG: GspE/PulE family protein [Gallionella sp.]|nr:GspE/PulE family protein [Gallionella sp.]